MARLSKHGQNRQIEYVSFKKAYCSDGTILKNWGSGWKIYGKLKAGWNWIDAHNKSVANQKKKFQACPFYAKFYQTLKELCPSMPKRSYVLTALEVSSHDPDGMWSDLDDWYETRGYLTFDDVNELCKTYDLAMMEQKNLATETV